MTNEHIWELMQRDLDGDLSLQEQQLLQSFVQKDPDLQLTYDRLKRVSDQLEQLPPVTPAFSIVDSILPQLEAAAFQPAAVPIAMETELPRLELKKTDSRQERPKWKGLPVWMARVGSGLAAACLLLGLFFMVNGPKENGNDPYKQGTSVTPPSNPAPAVAVPLPEKESPNLSPSSNETKPPVATQEKSPTNSKKPTSKPKQTEKKPSVKSKPINSKPAVTVQPQEDPKPSFPFGTEIKPGKDDKPDKDTDEEKDNDRDDKKNDDGNEDEDDDKDKDKKKRN